MRLGNAISSTGMSMTVDEDISPDEIVNKVQWRTFCDGEEECTYEGVIDAQFIDDDHLGFTPLNYGSADAGDVTLKMLIKGKWTEL